MCYFFLASAIRGRKCDSKNVGNKKIESKTFMTFHPIAYVSISVYSLPPEEKMI